ncbi:hypothetical protein C8J56DRAFT_934059 [Mycena floridula]|nr:hypothetical protein C8J56DRAFT_934059 [Mycena floridula]
MEQYFTTTHKPRFTPYNDAGRKRARPHALNDTNDNISSSAITKVLLKTLEDESNPITHSDRIERSGHHVTSISTGHQVSDGSGNRRLYLQHREGKLGVQRDADGAAEGPQVLRNVRVYIDGLLNNTTDIEMKRIVLCAGGRILPTASGATHILTSMQLSASKTHKILNAKLRNPVFVIKPEWVFDSIKAGKRLSERDYAVIKNTGSRDLMNMWKK